MAKPIFIVGKNRSGTKWLSNILLRNKNISGIQNEYHGGILETNIVNDMARIFGSLSNKDSFAGLIECFSGTDFFRLSKLSKCELYKTRSKNYYEFLKRFMDIYAKKASTEFWLQKIDVKQLKGFYDYFSDARFIVIERDIINNIRSAIGLQRKNKIKTSVVKETILYIYSLKCANRYKNRRKNFFFLRYEDLERDKVNVLRKICDFLGLTYSNEMLSNKFKRNTSFSNQKERDTILSKKDRLSISLLSFALKYFPMRLYDFFYSLKCLKVKSKPFQRDTFHMICKDFNIVDLDN